MQILLGDFVIYCLSFILFPLMLICNRCWLTFWTGTNSASLKLVPRMLAVCFVGWSWSSFSWPSLLFYRLFFNAAPFACFSNWVMWSDSTATRLSIVNHCFILKGVFDFCLVYAHFFLQIPLYWLLLWKAHLAKLCSAVSFIMLPLAWCFAPYQGYIWALRTSIIWVALLPLISLSGLCLAVSPCQCPTGPPRTFTGQKVAAFYSEKGSWLRRLGCWKQCFDGKNWLEGRESKMSGSEILYCGWKWEGDYISN